MLKQTVCLMMTVMMMVTTTTTTLAKTTTIDKTITMINDYDDYNIDDHNIDDHNKNIKMNQDKARQGGRSLAPPCIHVHKSFCPTPAAIPYVSWAN